MDTVESPSDDRVIDGSDSSISDKDGDLGELRAKNDALAAELGALRASFQSESTALEEKTILLQHQKDEALKLNVDYTKIIEEVSRERDSLRDEVHELRVCLKEREDEFLKKIDEELRVRESLQDEVELCREKIKELVDENKGKIRIFWQSLDSVRTVKESMARILESVDEEEVGNVSVVDEEEVGNGSVVAEKEDAIRDEMELDEELRAFSKEVMEVSKLASTVELKVSEYQKMRKKEKRELENSVVSLTEENRDINSLLRIALVEKEAVEKSLNRLKGNSDQKRVALLQIAERGLQRVGFGFMMGTATEQMSENPGANGSNKSDSSECEEEVVSLASTVERIMKNLRLEITQLRRSLEESRSDNERLQSLTEKQAQELTENTFYIQELEHRETLLARNVEDLLIEMKETEEDVVRWREACELEVEAGKHIVEERDKVAAILQKELEKTKAALEISNSKLKLKEDVAAAAMAAQAAAERSLQLSDSRAAGLRERIEELSRQLEEAESRERNGRWRLRHLCWPWRPLKLNPGNHHNTNTVRSVRRMLPEMQSLLHYNI